MRLDEINFVTDGAPVRGAFTLYAILFDHNGNLLEVSTDPDRRHYWIYSWTEGRSYQADPLMAQCLLNEYGARDERP